MTRLAARVGIDRAPSHADSGSVLPLMLGMVLCLLLLGAGATAATSAFTARANLQHVCDGAAAAAGEAAQRGDLAGPPGAAAELAQSAVADYVAVRSPHTGAGADIDGDWVRVRCQTDAPIALGALFGSPTMAMTIDVAVLAALAPSTP